MQTALPGTFSTDTEAKLSASRLKTPARAHKAAFADGGVLRIPPTAPKTLTEAFLQNAAHKDRGVTFISSRGEQSFLSYNELSQRARKILSGLRRHGLTAGSRAILQVDSLPDHFASFWACVLGGIIP